MRNINVVAKKMAKNGLKIANSLGCAFRFESDFIIKLERSEYSFRNFETFHQSSGKEEHVIGLY